MFNCPHSRSRNGAFCGLGAEGCEAKTDIAVAKSNADIQPCMSLIQWHMHTHKDRNLVGEAITAQDAPVEAPPLVRKEVIHQVFEAASVTRTWLAPDKLGSFPES